MAVERATNAVTIELEGGLTLRLQYDFRTLKKIRDELGISLMKGSGMDTVDEDKLPQMILYGALNHQPDATLEGIEAGLTGDNIKYALQQVFLAATGVDIFPDAVKNGSASPQTATTSLPN
jgi:hypothetical protein